MNDSSRASKSRGRPEEEEEGGCEQFGFFVIGPAQPRRLEQRSKIVTAPSRTGRERSPMVLVRYLTDALGAPRRDGAIALDYAEWRFLSVDHGNA